MPENYQKVLDILLKNMKSPKKLLLHSCCAPCSSYVLEYLSNYFLITIFYYNPNIYPYSEYQFRIEEQKRLISEMKFKYPVDIIDDGYNGNQFYEVTKGYEDEPEGGKRCSICYHLRLCRTSQIAFERKYDYFSTTLSISPMKNAQKLNEIGGQLAQEYNLPYLFSDFKKKNGYLRSIELSKEYGLYRQNYCGCMYSKRDSLNQ